MNETDPNNRLLPILSFMYLFNAIDRSNLGNAKTDTLLKDLEMTNTQYSVRLRAFMKSFTTDEMTAHIGLVLRDFLWIRCTRQHASEKINGQNHAANDDARLGLRYPSTVCCIQLGRSPRMPVVHGSFRSWIHGR